MSQINWIHYLCIAVVETTVVGNGGSQTASKSVTIEPSFLKASIEEKKPILSEENPLPTPYQREEHNITPSGSSDKVSTERSTSVESLEKLHNVEKNSSEVLKSTGTSNSQDEETNSKSGTSPSFMENFSKSERDMLIQINAHDKSEITEPTDMVCLL